MLLRILFLLFAFTSVVHCSTYGYNAVVDGTLTVGGVQIKPLTAGTGINIAANGVVSNTDPGSSVSLTDGGVAPGHATLVSSTSAAGQPRTVGLLSGSGITITGNGTQDVTIAGPTFGSGAATGLSLVSSTSTSTAFRTVGLLSGSGINLSGGGTQDLTITGPTFSSGAATGASLVSSTSTATAFRPVGLLSGSGISISGAGTQDLTISGPSFSNGGATGASLVSSTSTSTSFRPVGLIGGTGVAITGSGGQDLTIALQAATPTTVSFTAAASTRASYTNAGFTGTTTASVTTTATSGTQVLVVLTVGLTLQTNVDAQCWVTYAVSGGTTLAASDAQALTWKGYGGNSFPGFLRMSVTNVQALSAGSNTITVNWKTTGGTCAISAGVLSVVPLN